MAQHEVSALFRAAVTYAVSDIPTSDRILDDLDGPELVEFAGLGVDMVASVVKLAARNWGIAPIEAWELFVQMGKEQDLPGMELT